jgi:hypothetical protein
LHIPAFIRIVDLFLVFLVGRREPAHCGFTVAESNKREWLHPLDRLEEGLEVRSHLLLE